MKIDNINLHNRLDIFVKILYIKAYLEKKDFSFYQKLYQKHILLYNWWFEDNKKNIKDFENNFQNLILNIKKNWFNENFPIPINKNWELLNWAHRLACCIYFNITPIFQVKEGKWVIWDFEWFEKNSFSLEEIIEILKINTDYNNYFFYIIWPDLLHKEKEIIKDIKQKWNLIWKINFKTNKNILSEFIKDLYSYDKWNIKWWLWIDKKIILLNKNKNNNIKILLFNNKEDFNQRNFKDKLREKYKKHVSIQDWTEHFYTFHSWEDEKENKYMKNIILNYKNLKNYSLRVAIEDNSKLIKNIIDFYNYCDKNNLEKNNFCIVWSSVLEIFWLKKANDLDLISLNINSWKLLKITNTLEIFEYNYSHIFSNKELILNEKNHIFFRWLKILSPDIFLKIKLSFNRKKDIKDIKLLQNLSLNNNNSILRKIYFEIRYYKKKNITYFILFSIKYTKKIWIYKQISYLWRKYILKNYKKWK